MFCAKYFMKNDEALFADASRIRYEVFVEEQNCDPKNELDAIDDIAIHTIVYDGDNTPIGTARLYTKEGAWLIGRVAVRKPFRKQGYGTLLMRMLCAKALEIDPSLDFIVYAQCHAIPMYETIGFVTEGDILYEENIAHKKMRIKAGEYKAGCKQNSLNA